MNVVLASAATEVNDYKNYLEVTNRVCYYDEPNGNSVQLPYDDNALAMAQTLIDMPVQAMYTVNADGEPDLLDHCVSVDEEGNYTFNTISIGVHTDVWIEKDSVTTYSGETKELPCLFAKQKIWKRYGNYVSAILKLYNEGNLHNSWEISSFEYEYKSGIKTLLSYVFDGNAFLGSTTEPAYGKDAKILDISQKVKERQLMIASALAHDVSDLDITFTGKEEEVMSETINKTYEETVVDKCEENVVSTETKESAEANATNEEAISGVDDSETPETKENEVEDEKPADPVDTETSSLSTDDLYRLIDEAINATRGCWGYIIAIFPEDHIVWFRDKGCKAQTDVRRVGYTIDNDSVKLGEVEEVVLTVEPVKLIDTVASLSQTVVSAQQQIEELKEYKGKYEDLAQKVEMAQKEKVKEYLTEIINKAECLSIEDKQSDEVASLIESCNEDAVKLFIAERYIQYQDSKANDTAEKTTPNIATNLLSALGNNAFNDPDENRAKSMHDYIYS